VKEIVDEKEKEMMRKKQREQVMMFSFLRVSLPPPKFHDFHKLYY
jgi:hypothetical protein